MIRLYFIITTIFLILLTITAGMLKPGINKPVRFAANDFSISNTELAINPDGAKQQENIPAKPVQTNSSTTKIEEKVVDVSTPSTTKNTKIIEKKNNAISKTVEVQKPAEKVKTSTKILNTTPPESQTKTVTKEAKNAEKHTEQTKPAQIPQSIKDIVNNTQKPSTEDPKPQPQEKVKLPQIDPTPKPSQNIIEKIPPAQRPLTEQEEIIVWNTWRSNLQNRIMHDTQISAPIGTTFKFSFTVDKKGRISNLRTWAIPESYNPMAINYLKPLILKYMETNDSILNFPARTKRVITNVTGGFVISTQDRFSTPNDFSDIEKIKTIR